MSDKPNISPIYMWIIFKLFFIILPLTFLLALALISVGFPNSVFTIFAAMGIAFFASNSYDRLTVAVRDWIKQELND